MLKPYLKSVRDYISRMRATWTVIPMLHSIGPADLTGITPNRSLNVSPELLEAFVAAARANRWAFISLDELADALAAGRVPRRAMVITIDDGYLNNLTAGYPIFRAFNVPFCIYVTTGFVGDGRRIWWFDLEEALLEVNSVCLPDGKTERCASMAEKVEIFNLVKCQIMSYDHRIRDRALEWLHGFPRTGGGCRDSGRQMLTWDDIRTLRKDPLATIGAHTVTHPVLTSLTEDDARFEFEQSKFVLEQQAGGRIDHFAYPFGGAPEAGPREYQLARESGFRTAVTTTHGVVENADVNLFSLRRLVFRENLDGGAAAVVGSRDIRRRFQRGHAVASRSRSAK